MSEPTTRFIVGKREQGKRLDHFLHERIPGLSRNRIQQAIRERVTVSWGVAARPSTPVRPGGEVHIGYTPLVEPPLEIIIPILHRGQGWMAVDKPPSIPVHPVNKVRENSLIRLLRRQEGHEELRLAHRLDRETSGALIIAENAATARDLSMSFAEGRMHKEYLAVVRGSMRENRGRIDLPIGDAVSSRIYHKLETGHGKAARTDWQVERRLGDLTVVRLFPRTGRRHQLRVHLAAIGHPVLGDPLYGRSEEAYLAMVGGDDDRSDGPGPRRQLLHCASMEFEDPASRRQVRVEAPLHEDMRRAIAEAESSE